MLRDFVSFHNVAASHSTRTPVRLSPEKKKGDEKKEGQGAFFEPLIPSSLLR
jgi:hypothetical protein